MKQQVSEIYKSNFNLYEQNSKMQYQNSNENSGFQKILEEEIDKLKEADKKILNNEKKSDNITLDDILIAKGFGIKRNNINTINSQER